MSLPAIALDLYSDLVDEDLDAVAEALAHHIRRVTACRSGGTAGKVEPGMTRSA